MLSHKNENANVLLRRKAVTRRRGTQAPLKETERVPTSGANWKEPFELSLGISGPELDYLKAAVFSNAREVLLVEGPTDKAYFDDLLDSAHGDNQLVLRGQVLSYDGIGNIENGALVKFLVGLFRVPIVTFDLDKDAVISKKLENIGLARGTHFFAVGKNQEGYRSIEGLLPTEVLTAVMGDHPDIVMAMRSDRSHARKSASNEFKRLCRERFKADAVPHSTAYSELYKVVKAINKAIAGLRKGAS